MTKIIPKTVTEIIDTDYRMFSMYTIENRAIPSVVDGFKNVQRKLIYAMLNEHGGKKTKIADLTISRYNYHHGETSAADAAVGLAMPWNNNAPLFDGHGNFGSRMVQEAASPRYIYASLSNTFKKFFVDTEVAPPAFDPDNPEPAFYLPIIPWVLINGIGGMAVGFKAEILPRSVKDVLAATKDCLKDPVKYLKANKDILPTFPSFKGTVEKISPNQYRSIGVIEYVGKYTYKITELPIGYDRAKYVTLLNSMVDDGKIKDYDDECSKTGFGFSVKVSIEQKTAIDADPIKYFKLDKIHTEILTTLDEKGKLKIFESVAELVHYFVAYRLTKFDDKIRWDIQSLERDLEIMLDKMKFIKAVIDNKIDFRKTTKADLLEFISTTITSKDHGKRFVSIPLYECTKDAIENLKTQAIAAKEEIGILKKTTAKELFENRLTTCSK